MTSTSLSVPTISCDHCKMSIEGAVANLAGVDGVTVNIEPKTVDVAFDEAAVSLDRIIETIEEQGYEVDR